MASTPIFTPDDYTIALICPMPLEQAPVEAMLDEIHPDLPVTTLDKNSYTFGRITNHNVVIAGMPKIGNSSAASVATQVLNDFRRLRFSLLIGIGGGIPNLSHGVDIRLGDVVVSKPQGIFGGVVQFRQGKVLSRGRFERTGALRSPPDILLATMGRMEALHRRVDSAIPRLLGHMVQRFPKMVAGGYVYQGVENDQLFRAEYEHAEWRRNCEGCDLEAVIRRGDRIHSNPVIHYGTIGSSDVVVKDGQLRDMLRDDLGIYCVEMEAAGLLDSFPCLVIRGICDYADSHKNDRWQPYAAAAAAAYAKELLSYVPVLNDPQHDRPQRGHTVLSVRSVRNLVNGSVAGDVVGGDKVTGDKVWQEWRN
ncbi:purine and uridine phosphorylase [Penicillium canariense]|uniref:Purine and uridine phosphorylase n=1 Tax=Penicillium canariense TaxID=189055 RepID=A0A9W9HYU4_9EURO|nr:purine and uridine phosphorylase [Penicillium canariense]KAJ5160050.1 purine and uridine phosphorylase [Penicillium canariense]